MSEDRGPASSVRVVVRRGEHARFWVLAETLAGEPVVVMWDRRTGDRRSETRPVAGDRRRGDRRGPPPDTWTRLGFLTVREPAVA